MNYGYFDYEQPLFRPPSEAQSLIIQLTIGCSQNRCRFCGMYKMKTFRVRTLAAITAELATLPAVQRQRVQRIFLADGDALVAAQPLLVALLEWLAKAFPNLTRVGCYASPHSLTTKTLTELQALRELKLRILYFGLESGDGDTLQRVNKGYPAAQMLELCQAARHAGIKMSVTAILGLAGRQRSDEHAVATAHWINALSPEYFSLLTLFQRHNDEYFQSIQALSHGGILQETVRILATLNPHKTILRANHVSNFLELAGSYPKDRLRLLATAEAALAAARHQPWFNEIPDYREEYF